MPTRIAGLLSLLLVLVAVGCQPSEPWNQQREVISTDAAPEAIGPYSQGIRVGNTVYCSGQIGIDPEAGELVNGGTAAETRQAMENLRAVLKAANASMSDVVQTKVFLADLDDYGAMNSVYASYFDEAPPARAAVQADSLPAGAQVEIMVTARK